MTNSYLRQALLLLVLALAFFLIVVILLFSSARGEEGACNQWNAKASFCGWTLPGWQGRVASYQTGRFSYLHESRLTRHRRPRRSRRSFDFVARYNRVEGLYLGMRLPREDWTRSRTLNFMLWGEGGYGFSSKEWRYQVGLERSLEAWGNQPDAVLRFTLGAEAHDLTETQDEWIIPTVENSLAAFLIKEDFQDYYRRTGFSGYLEENVLSKILFRAEYRDDRYFNMPPDPAVRTATNWSLFGGKKQFRPNPLIDECHLRGAVGTLTLDTRDDKTEPDEGWYVQARAEFYGGQVKSDYEFDRIILDIRRYQPLSFSENLDFRLRLGTSRNPLPSQFLFDLGGISTLRGYPFKAFTGDRMFLANVEYRVRADSRALPLPLFDTLNLIVFFDAGLAWFSNDVTRVDRGWNYLTFSRFKTDVGIAITDRAGRVRLNFARRTDSAKAPIVVTFRINRAF